MDDLQRGIYRMVVKEVERTQPKREKNFLSKRDAVKLIKKFTKQYTLQEYLNATEAASVWRHEPGNLLAIQTRTSRSSSRN